MFLSSLKKLSGFLLITILVALGSCSKSDSNSKVTPTNIEVTADVTTDGSGQVTFHASGYNVDYFTYSFGDTVGATTKTFDVTKTHTYAASGTYTVMLTATSADNLTATATTSVTVVNSGVTGPTGVGYSTPDHYDGMTLVWQDEFSGTSLSSANWNFETGGGGWGNAELEYYQAANTSVHDGSLYITAKKESVGGMQYTSSRITTQNKQTFKYGRIDMRAILPKGQGMWPALWMLGSSISSTPWPACGEIDIMELTGGTNKDNLVYGTGHWDDNGHQYKGGTKALASGTFNDEYHVFTMIWSATALQWYVDDVLYFTLPTNGTTMSEFQANFFFIFNVAVGGNFPGNPDSSTVFPQSMIVDYVRVFQ